MKTLTLEEVFAPLSVTCRILGMIPLSTKNGRLEFSKPALLQTFAFLTTGTVLTAMFIVNFHKYVPYVPSKHNVMIKTAIMLRNSGSMVVTLLVVLSGYRNYFKLRDIKNTISTVDLKLVRMEGGECLAQDNYKKHKYLIKSLVFLNLVVVVGTEICTVLIRGHFSFVQILIVVYPQCIIRTLNATFYLFSSIIQTRFKMINRLFSTRFSKHQRNCFFENVTHIVSLHQVLVKLCAELNSIFSPSVAALDHMDVSTYDRGPPCCDIHTPFQSVPKTCKCFHYRTKKLCHLCVRFVLPIEKMRRFELRGTFQNYTLVQN
jgi:hypothetical protein